MLDTAAEIHAPNAWENFLSTQPEWLKFTNEEHAAAQAAATRKSDWRGRVLVLSAAVSFSVALFVWMVL